MRTPDVFTRADYRRLPEGFPAQLVEGWLVKEPTPTYGHQHFVRRLCAAVSAVVPPDLVLPSPVAVPIDDINVYQPDLCVFAAPPPLEGNGDRVPRVVFEVLSPSSRGRDRGVKTQRYLAAGIEEVWLVDLATGTVEVRDAAGVRTAKGAESLASRALPGFAVVPRDLFAAPR